MHFCFNTEEYLWTHYKRPLFIYHDGSVANGEDIIARFPSMEDAKAVLQKAGCDVSFAHPPSSSKKTPVVTYHAENIPAKVNRGRAVRLLREARARRGKNVERTATGWRVRDLGISIDLF